MADQQQFDKYKHRLTMRTRFLARKELKQLPSIVRSDESIRHCVYGYFHGGSGLVVVTDQRVIFIEKRPLYTYVEDILLSEISSIRSKKGIFTTSIALWHRSRKVYFSTIDDALLRDAAAYVYHAITPFEEGRIESARRAVNTIARKRQLVYRKHPAWRPHAPHMIKRYISKLDSHQSAAAASNQSVASIGALVLHTATLY